MATHTTSGRWQLGLSLALLTAGLWATLPAALKIALGSLDAWTLTWVRFLFAFLVLGTWLGVRGRLGALRRLGGRDWLLLMFAAATLIGNYLLYLLGVQYTTPGNAQLLIQAAPLLMALGGIAVFGERYSTGQWLGMVAIVVGLCLFFADQLGTGDGNRQYVLGSTLVLMGALSWALYALAQKQLLNRLGSATILVVIYAVASVALAPLADVGAVLKLEGVPLWMVLFAAVNTLAAYGAFAEALAHWEASRVSAILALTPLLAMATVEVVHQLLPHLLGGESIRTLGWIGAAMVVAGSCMSALLRRRASAPIVATTSSEGTAETLPEDTTAIQPARAS